MIIVHGLPPYLWYDHLFRDHFLVLVILTIIGFLVNSTNRVNNLTILQYIKPCRETVTFSQLRFLWYNVPWFPDLAVHDRDSGQGIPA